MQGGSKAKPKGGGKRAVNRHQTQSKASAGAQERSIERSVRQAAAKEVRAPVDCDGCGMARFDVKAVGRDYNGDPDAPSLCFICRAEHERGRQYDRKARRYRSVNEMNAEEDDADHAAHWRALAAQERERLSWDKHALPAIVESRAKMYEGAARSIELGAETGVPHCACHLIPLKACAERAAGERKR
jgi:hypothetical protein